MYKVIFAVVALAVTGCTAQRRMHVVKTNMPTVAYLEVDGTFSFFDGHKSTGTMSGTGVAISRYGHILTCAHLLSQGQKTMRVEMAGSSVVYVGKVISTDEDRDLALIKIDAITTKYVIIAPPGVTTIGQDILVIGNPFQLKWSVTAGIVSAFRQQNMVIQVDADINPGNSGGPVFNLEGELVGIASSMYSPIPGSVGLNFAVSVESIREFLQQFEGL